MLFTLGALIVVHVIFIPSIPEVFIIKFGDKLPVGKVSRRESSVQE